MLAPNLERIFPELHAAPDRCSKTE